MSGVPGNLLINLRGDRADLQPQNSNYEPQHRHNVALPFVLEMYVY